MRFIIGIVALIFATSAAAQLPVMKLGCGKVAGYKVEVERKYMSSAAGGGPNGMYTVDVTFITKRPDNKLADKALRECIAASLKLDDKKDILATAWFRPMVGMDPNDDEHLHPYGGMNFLSYTASKRSIDVHELNLTKR